jgi:hypothetical protein
VGEPTIETEIDRLYGLPLAEARRRDARATLAPTTDATTLPRSPSRLARGVGRQPVGWMVAEIAGWRTRLPSVRYGIVQAARQALDAAVRWATWINPA